jgi:hypothetical protein
MTMKHFAIFAFAAAVAGVAHADPVTVLTPKDPASKEQAEAYVAELDRAVKKVCADASAPIVGFNYYSYIACLKSTRAEVAKTDPTGLYAKVESSQPAVLAAR